MKKGWGEIPSQFSRGIPEGGERLCRNDPSSCSLQTLYKIMKTLKKYGLLISALFIATVSYSQDSTATFNISGSIDTYARTAFGARNAFGGPYAPSTAFANLKGFSLGMANLIASYEGEKAGFVADLVFGPRGRDAVFVEGGPFTGQRIINQMYAYAKIGKSVTVNIGQFNTFLGYEVISPTVNVNYSTSYLFSYGPFTHTGLRVDFDFGGGFNGKLAVMNPTDMLEFNAVNTYTLGLQLGHSTDAGGVWLNVLYGDQDGKLDEDDEPMEDPFTYTSSAGNLFQIDLTGGYNIGEKFYLGFNTSFQSLKPGQTFTSDVVGVPPYRLIDLTGDATSFVGFALYPKLTLTDNFLLALRGEYFSIKKDHLDIIGRDGAGDGSVIAATLSANYKVGPLTFIPEIRLDKTSELSFADKDGKATDSMTSFLLAAVYKF